MNTETTTRPRNGVRNGDVSYITSDCPTWLRARRSMAPSSVGT